MTVNLEAYVLFNMIMNALLLLLCGRLSGLRPRVWRLAVSSLAGAVYAVISNLPALLLLQAWYLRFACAAAMCAFTFMPSGIVPLIRAAGCFFISAFLLGGTGFSFMYMLGARGYGWQLAALIVAIGASGVVFLTKGFHRAAFSRALRTVCIEYRGLRARVPALVDTGNALTEPLSGLPVLVVEKRLIINWPANGDRPVAFHTLGGDGLMPTFEPDAIYIRGKPLRRMRVAVYPGTLSGDGSYAALLPWPYGVENNNTHQIGVGDA